MTIQDVLVGAGLVLAVFSLLVAIFGIVMYLRTPIAVTKPHRIIFRFAKANLVNGRVVNYTGLPHKDSIQQAVRYVPNDFASWNGIIGWQLINDPYVSPVTYVRTYVDDAGETQQLWIAPYDSVTGAVLTEWPPSALAVLLSQGQ